MVLPVLSLLLIIRPAIQLYNVLDVLGLCALLCTRWLGGKIIKLNKAGTARNTVEQTKALIYPVG